MTFAWGQRTYVMGILNLTPDSFSGDGLLNRGDALAAAVAQARAFAAAGADILDLGGESSRPGGEPVSAQEELQRVLPAVKAVRAAVDLPLSVDTYRAEVAEAVLAAGAAWINDIWGLRMDPDLPGVVARAGCPVVIMHNRFAPRTPAEAQRLADYPHGKDYTDVVTDVYRELERSITLARDQGIRKSQLIIDPGLGFGKTVPQNLALLNHLDHFKGLGYPILIGPSRKGFIGKVLNLPPEERVEGTAATVVIGIERGADIIRVHDVQAMVRVARMTDRLVRH